MLLERISIAASIVTHKPSVGIIPIIVYIRNRLKKPQLLITPIIETNKVKDISKNIRNLRFNITVKNTGNSVASDCTIFARFTSIAGEPFNKLPFSKVMIPLDWTISDEKNRVMDLLPNKYSEGLVELPLRVSIDPEHQSVNFTNSLRISSDEGYVTEDIFHEDENKNRFYNLRVIFYIKYNSTMGEKQFLIKIKTNPFPISPNDIKFTSLGTHS